MPREIWCDCKNIVDLDKDNYCQNCGKDLDEFKIKRGMRPSNYFNRKNFVNEGGK